MFASHVYDACLYPGASSSPKKHLTHLNSLHKIKDSFLLKTTISNFESLY